MSTPRKHSLPPPPVSSIGLGSLSDPWKTKSNNFQKKESVTSMSISDGSINEEKFNSIQNSWSVLTGQMRPGTLERILMKLLSHWRTWWMKTALMMTTAPLSVCGLVVQYRLLYA
ncbi:hypothetical protein UPYG_G00289700 [Umbra pygmaea]|uniref:Uncharacterized protein n=1 Tax=Umbra pygmaea TaxID=75934 RepID=A0ABD0WKG6_UMBPY